MRSRLQWAGHVGRMADDRLPKRAAESREEVQDKTREANAEMGGLCSEMRGRQERRKTGRRRQQTGEGGKDYQMRR